MLTGDGPNRSERKKIEILAAARGVFLRQGYPDTGMEVVARMASVSTATLYAYFPSKAKLFEAVVDDTVRDMAEPVRHSARAEGDARVRLNALALGYATFMAEPATRAMFRMVTTERKRFEPVADQFLLSANAELGGATIRVLKDLVATGELSIPHPSWAAGQLLGMLDHATLVLGLSAGDEAQPTRPLADISADAVETFLARYGTHPATSDRAPGRPGRPIA